MEKRKRQRLKPNRRVSEPQTVSTWQWAVEGYSGPEERFHMCSIVAENPWRVLQGRASQVDSRVLKFPLRVKNGFGSRWRARLEAGRLSRWFSCFCLKLPTDLSWVLSEDVLCLQVSSVNLNSGLRGRPTWSQRCGPAVTCASAARGGVCTFRLLRLGTQPPSRQALSADNSVPMYRAPLAPTAN